jgi:hypothetical protein
MLNQPVLSNQEIDTITLETHSLNTVFAPSKKIGRSWPNS